MKRTDLELDTINKCIARAISSAKMDAYDRVLEILNNQTEMICKVMDSSEAYNIYFSSRGEKFTRMNEKRNQLWCKRFQIQNFIAKVWEERAIAYNEFQKMKEYQ